ncbi:MAG: RHS repeat-associated core domain-containing protein [Pirellulales bacterium]
MGVGVRAIAVANSFTYTGRQLDSESGIYQYRYRYYHAQLGRFVARDSPITTDGPSLYASYFAVIGVDPLGLSAVRYWDEYHSVYAVAYIAPNKEQASVRHL